MLIWESFFVISSGCPATSRYSSNAYNGPCLSHNTSSLIYVYDQESGVRYLVDTGAVVSVIPPSPWQRLNNSKSRLYAANGTEIPVYGSRKVYLSLNDRLYKFPFLVAKVKYPTIGADFLSCFGLLVDLKNCQLIDSTSNSIVKCYRSHAKSISASFVSPTIGSPYYGLLREFSDLTVQRHASVRPRHNTIHRIITTGAPVHFKARAVPEKFRRKLKDKLIELLESGDIIRSNSPYASPIAIVPKGESDIRLCMDYRALNNQTVKDKWPVPHIKDFTRELAGCRYFSKIDLAKAYHQIPLHPRDQHKAAFICPEGLFQPTTLPFGLTNACGTFCRFIAEVTLGIENIFVFFDDILVASVTEHEHLDILRQLFVRLRQYGLVLNIDKCEFGKSEIEFLGYKVTSEGITPLPSRVSIIQDFPKPVTAKQLRSFLGIVCYYHRFVKSCAEILQPLHRLVSNSRNKQSRIVWDDETTNSFELIKSELASGTLLAHPRHSSPLSLLTDASKIGMGAVFQQHIDGKWQPLGFYSKTFNQAQRKYTTFDRELLAAYSAIRHFHTFLKGRKFQLISDNSALVKALKNPTERFLDRQHNQLDFISQYTDNIRHLSGTLNCVADTLSRLEVNSIGHESYNFPSAIPAKDFKEAQEHDNELSLLLQNRCGHSLDLVAVPFPNLGDIFFDHSQPNRSRPYVPSSIRKRLFHSVHDLSHPGIRGTVDLISSRYVWPNMKRDVACWVRQCHPCQRSKIQRHTRSPIHSIPVPSERFHSINVDILGPLEYSHGFNYILMCIDRFSRWPECIPVKDIRSETIINAFINGWISRYGVPNCIITDRGSQFCSRSWTDLMQFLGIEHRTTLAYKPEQNSLIERFNRTLKSALRSMEDPRNWYAYLGYILLGLRSSLKEDLGMSASEMIYGTPLRLPGQLVDPRISKSTTDPHTYVNGLIRYFMSLRATQTRVQACKEPYVPSQLERCTHVYMRIDRQKKSLEPVYTGPHLVLSRSPKAFTIRLNDAAYEASIDRLKPAYIAMEDQEDELQPIPKLNIGAENHVAPKTSQNKETVATPNNIDVLPTDHTQTADLNQNDQHDHQVRNTSRSGRALRPPNWLKDYHLASVFEMDI